MILFWLLSTVMLALALMFIVPQLVRHQPSRDRQSRKELNVLIHKEHLQELQNELQAGRLSRDDFDKSVQELEKELLRDVATSAEAPPPTDPAQPVYLTLGFSLLLPALVVGAYLLLGDYKLIEAKPESPPPHAQQDEMHPIQEMVDKLNQRLQSQPDDLEGWTMLARSYLVLERYPDAVTAYRQASALSGEDPSLMADFAEALILSNDNNLDRESIDLVRRAIEIDPNQPKALWIAGYAESALGDNAKALEHWERLLPLLTPGGQDAEALKQNIAELRQSTNLPPAAELVASATEVPNTGNEAATTTAIDVEVSLDPALTEQAAPDSTVFIFARAAQGPAMPLAIVRKQVKELPIKVRLDDTLAMTPAMSLSKFNEVIVSARVSLSGEATPKSGDLQGSSDPLSLATVSSVKIIINQILP